MPSSTAPRFIAATSSGSGRCTFRTMSASWYGDAAMVAPAAANASSVKEEAEPAPSSTVTSTPRANNRLTVSGEAATRASCGRRSRGTAILTDSYPCFLMSRHHEAWFLLCEGLPYGWFCRLFLAACNGQMRPEPPRLRRVRSGSAPTPAEAYANVTFSRNKAHSPSFSSQEARQGSGAVLTDSFSDQLIAMLPRLRRFTRGLTGSAVEADDLVQGACERALARQHQFQPGTRFDSWMFRIAQTMWIDQVRSRAIRREESEIEDGPAGQRRTASPSRCQAGTGRGAGCDAQLARGAAPGIDARDDRRVELQGSCRNRGRSARHHHEPPCPGQGRTHRLIGEGPWGRRECACNA